MSLVAYGVFALACIAGRNVSAAGAPAEDASVTFDFLSSAAADQLVCCNHAFALVGLCALHRASSSGFFTGHPLPRMQVVAALACGCSTRQSCKPGISSGSRQSVWPRYALLALALLWSSLGNHVHGAAASRPMNLFCVGLSHHTADVATREQFCRRRHAQSIARQAGCAEALVLTTCNRVEVYGVRQTSGFPPTKLRGAHRKNKSRSGQLRVPFYRYED
jgi:hypothetical protein